MVHVLRYRFKVPMFSVAAIPLNVLFSPVAYLRNDEAHAVIEKVIGNVQKNSDFLRSLDRSIIVQMIFTTFLAAVTCLKHEGFREEREWRAIYSPNRLGSSLMEHSTEVISGVPQIVYKLPLDEKVSTDIADLDFSLSIRSARYRPHPTRGRFLKRLSPHWEMRGFAIRTCTCFSPLSRYAFDAVRIVCSSLRTLMIVHTLEWHIREKRAKNSNYRKMTAR